MAKRPTSVSAPPPFIDLGENPVNRYQAREYAKESSPSSLAVILELTENARDNGTDVTLTIDVEASRVGENGVHVLVPKSITCEDNGTGLSHTEFLNRFCGAFSDSTAHHDTDRAGRNGVGTKTYTSVSERIVVRTTTARPSEGLDEHRAILAGTLPEGVVLPLDGKPDTVWRVYEFRLHNRAAVPSEWRTADAQEMGTVVELGGLRPRTEVVFETLLERLSYNREWLQNSAHSLTLQLTGNVPASLASKKRIHVRAWNHPTNNWLCEATGKSSEPVTVYDPTSKETTTIEAAIDFAGVLEFDFRVVGKGPDGQMHDLQKPALLLEICGALPYAPNLENVKSARTLPLLTFLGLEHASSIGAFCNCICGWARINALPLKEALRNNKTTLASGPDAEHVDNLRIYLHRVFRQLHKAWYAATRSSQDEAASDALKEAEVEVNLALKGVHRSPYPGAPIVHGEPKKPSTAPPPPRRHRWECGNCGKRWLAAAGFSPRICAEVSVGSGKGEGCGSDNIGLAKNQPRIGDCEIRIEQLGDKRLPAIYQFDRIDDDLELPVVRINLASPRYIELRGVGSMSGQAQKRLKQYLVDVALVAIAEFNAKTNGSDFAEELGELYFNRMLRTVGIKQYNTQLERILASTTGAEDQRLLA
jgi:hypothetical protein